VTQGRPPAPRSLASSSEPLVQAHDVALVDLDGVVYLGREAVAGAVAYLAAARTGGMHLGYVTNNAARTPHQVARHLRELGIELDDGDVVTSAQAAARLVAAAVPAGSKVLVIGGTGLVQALAEHGLHAVSTVADEPAAVVQGFHPSVGWELLAEGSYAVAAGLPWVASNLDLSVPTPRGRAPGNGTLVAAIRAATGSSPVVAGKPEPALVRESVLRTGSERPLMVGDRLDTDISGATRYQMPSLLVLTGVTSLAELVAAEGDERPDFVGADLGALLSDQPAVTVDRAAGGIRARCAGWEATVEDGRLRLRVSGTPAPLAGLAALRAVVAAGWAATDAGGSPVDVETVGGQLDDLSTGPSS